MKKFFKHFSSLLVLTLLIQLVLPISNLAYATDKDEPIYQENLHTTDLQYTLEDDESQIENDESLLDNDYSSIENSIEPPKARLVTFFLRAYVKAAIEEKMGEEIEKRIGDQVKQKVVPQMQDAAEKAAKDYGYTDFVGAKKSGSTVNQGEHIFEVLGPNGNPVLKGHVNINPSRNTTTWHWHTKADNFEWHHGQIQLNHNSLPKKWGN